jgi:hypothetical protein
VGNSSCKGLADWVCASGFWSIVLHSHFVSGCLPPWSEACRASGSLLILRSYWSRNANSIEVSFGWCRKCFCHVENLQIGTRRIEWPPPKLSWSFGGLGIFSVWQWRIAYWLSNLPRMIVVLRCFNVLKCSISVSTSRYLVARSFIPVKMQASGDLS